MKTAILSLLLGILVFTSCGGDGDEGQSPLQTESTTQVWSGAEYTIKTPIAKGAIVLTVPDKIGGSARLIIPSNVTAQNNPTITITFESGASFAGGLSVASAHYAGTVILKQISADLIAVGAQSTSTSEILTVNLPLGSFEFACGKINGKASIATRPGTFILGGVVAGDITVEKGSVRLVVGGEAINITLNDNEPLIIEGKITGTITVSPNASSSITVGAGASVGAIHAPQSSVVIQPSSSKNTSVGSVSGKDVSIGEGATTGDITISAGGTLKVEAGSTVDGSIDASDASSSQIEGTVTGEVKAPASNSSGAIDDWVDNGASAGGNPK